MARGDMDPMLSYTGEEIPEEQRTLGVSEASPGPNVFSGAGDFVYRFDPESGSYTIVEAPREYQNLVGVVVSPGSRAYDSIQAEHQTGQSLWEAPTEEAAIPDPLAAADVDPAGSPEPVAAGDLGESPTAYTPSGDPGESPTAYVGEPGESGGLWSEGIAGRLGSALMPGTAERFAAGAPARQARREQSNAEYARAREAGEIPASLDQRIFAAVKAAFGSLPSPAKQPKKAAPSAEPEEASTDSGMDSGEYGDTGG